MVENDEWENVKEGDRVIRRRVYTIPAPEGETSVRAKTKKKPLSKHQRMLRQMKAQRELEREQQAILGSFADGALKDQIVQHLKKLLLLVTVGVILLYAYAPDFLFKWLFRSKPKLADRSLMTVYPAELQVRKSLPLFFQAYAIARLGNEAARKAVKHVASLRHVATDPGKYKQKIYLHAWEHMDFVRQMKDQRKMNAYCGEGFREQYKGAPGLDSKKKRDDLLLWCLLANGHHDGYVKFETAHIRPKITREQKGVAIRYAGRNRIHSDSFLLLPMHGVQDLKGKRKLPPSTMVAFAALEWLRTNAPLSTEAYTKLFEEFLYEWIEKEGENWEFLNAGCTMTERQLLAVKERLIATNCRHVTVGNEENEEECCSFYDPNLKPILGTQSIETDDEEI